MDTDDMSDMSWEIIVRAAQISDTLKADLGARSQRYENEDDWLRGVRKFLQKILEKPDEYVDSWGLEEAEGVSANMMRKIVTELLGRTDETLGRPLGRRSKKMGGSGVAS